MTTLFYSPVDSERVAALTAAYPEISEEARDLLSAAGEEDLSAAVFAGCLSLCIAEDGLYAFTFPVPLGEEGNPDAFLDRWDRYILGEEIPYVLTEVPAERLPALRTRYRRVAEMPLDEEGTTFLVRAVTEIEETESLPTLVGESVTLAPFSAADTSAYAALCRDTETLRYYGYDMRADVGWQTDDDCFLLATTREWDARRTLPLAVHAAGDFVGEILLYGFDAHGGASVAVRLLPAARGKGYAYDAVTTLLSYAQDTLDLLTVRAEVKEENLPSLRLFDRTMHRTDTRDGTVFFELSKS